MEAVLRKGGHGRRGEEQEGLGSGSKRFRTEEAEEDGGTCEWVQDGHGEEAWRRVEVNTVQDTGLHLQ